MRIDVSPWVRERIGPGGNGWIRAQFPVPMPRDSVLCAERGREGWGVTVARRGEVLASTHHQPTPQAAVIEAARLIVARIPSLAWCSLCAGAAVIEQDGEAYCARHEQAREVTAA